MAVRQWAELAHIQMFNKEVCNEDRTTFFDDFLWTSLSFSSNENDEFDEKVERRKGKSRGANLS